MAELEDIKAALRKWATCPLSRPPGELLPSLEKELEVLWWEFLEEQDVGPYYSCAFSDILDFDDDIEYLRDALRSWEGWGQQARDAFVEKYGLLVRTRVLTRDEYPKHWPPAGLSVSEVRERTLRTDALLYPHVSEKDLLLVLQEAIALSPEKFLSPTNMKIYIDARTVMGASKGKDTTFLLFDVTSGEAHAYPVHEDEFRANRGFMESWVLREPPDRR